MPAISIMLKPSSSLCNMKCEYCFYHSLAENRENFSYGFMSEQLFEDIFKKAVQFTKGMPINISFQGGEPLLRGLDFYKNIMESIRIYNSYNSPINFALQTNGTLINEDWCKFFKENNFLVGLSLDGNENQNAYRVDNDGNPTFEKVFKNAQMLKVFGVDFNILIVLTPLVAENIKEVYSFFTSNGFKHLQFIPCLSPLGGSKSQYSVTSEQYTKYLFELFGLYLQDFKSNNYTSVRHLDNLVMLANGGHAEQCGMNGHCSHQFVIEGDGTVFPCDFYCVDEYALGNIKNSDFMQLSYHPKAIKFIKSSLLIDEKCKECKYFLLCRGGCKREQLDIKKCDSYMQFFPFAIPHLKKMR